MVELTEPLEEKRGAFPRFYFIGDDDLLEILGQSTNPAVIQSHLKKLYQGVAAVQFNDDKTKIKAMVSAAGEEVSLDIVSDFFWGRVAFFILLLAISFFILLLPQNLCSSVNTLHE